MEHVTSNGSSTSFGAITIAASMGLVNLQHEPQRLTAEAERLNQDFEGLVMDNYKIFVENLTCSVFLRSEDRKISEIASELQERLHGLTQQCSAFRDRVNHFVEFHKRNRKTLQHHMQLVELLEVPQLVDACARNGFHDEALELANFVNGLERRHLLAAEVRSVNGKTRGGSGVIQSIVDEVHFTLTVLRQHLLQLLTENLSLPREIQILATLRKLDGLLVDRQLALERHENDSFAAISDKQREQLRAFLLQFAETRLQMDFLEARTVWLQRMAEKAIHGMGELSSSSSASVAAADGDLNLITAPATSNRDQLGPYGKAIELLEVNRSTWFSVVTQFNALFGDLNPSGTADATSFPCGAVLGAWASRQVHLLLNDLKSLLPQIEEGASLRTVLEQAIFFASRMGDVGCDFSGLIVPLFKRVLVGRIAKDLRVASANFKSILSTERFTIEIDDVNREQVIPLYLNQESGRGLTGDTTGGGVSPTKGVRGADEIAAPAALMTFPPLAYLLNCTLSVLNLLRECPVISAREAVLQEIRVVLVDCCRFLVGLAGDVQARGAKYLSSPGALANALSKEKARLTGSEVSPSGGVSEGEGSVAGQGGGTKGERSMDKLYGAALAKELIPHLLVCFELIYSGTAGGGGSNANSAGSKSGRLGTASPSGKSLLGAENGDTDTMSSTAKQTAGGFKVKKLADARALMSAEAYAVLSTCWVMLQEGRLLAPDAKKEEPKASFPSVLAAAPIDLLVSTAPSAATHGSAGHGAAASVEVEASSSPAAPGEAVAATAAAASAGVK